MKSSIAQRKRTALTLLEEQLVSGTKPVKGVYTSTDLKGNVIHVGKPAKYDNAGAPVYDVLKDGTKKLVLLEVLPLTQGDRNRKQAEIASLKRKLKIA